MIITTEQDRALEELAREREADNAEWAAEPDPLVRQGYYKARALARTLRKRAILQGLL